MRVPLYLHVVGILALVCYHIASINAAASRINSNEVEKPLLIDTLKQALKERALIRSGPEDEPMPRLDTKPRRFVKAKFARDNAKGDLLRQELAKETGDNCLARLLCGVQPQVSQTKSSAISDYAYLVKEFFEIFGAEPEELEEDPKKPEGEKKVSDDAGEEDDESDNEARSSELNGPEKVNITGSIEEVISTSTSATVDYVTTGATITDFLASSNQSKDSNIAKVTLEELVGDFSITADDVNSIRKSRSLLSAGELNKSEFIRRKIRELRVAKSDSKKLRIAGQIVTSIRQPRQCKQFNSVASEILSTCPLTTEVVRYFNSNLKNGSQIALVKSASNATDGGIVLLNDEANKPFSYFLDNSPIVANSKISTDLKNPTVPERFTTSLEEQIYEYQSRPWQKELNANQVSIAKPAFPPKKPEKEKDTKDEDDSAESDDEDDDQNDDDDEEGEEDEEEDQEEGDDEETNAEEEQEDSNEKYRIQIAAQSKHSEQEDSNNKYQKQIDVRDRHSQSARKWTVNKKSKKTKKSKKDAKPKPPTGLPPGMIKVYGIPQPSFDNEFTSISGQIGRGPVVIFDQDDYDSHLPHPGPPVKQRPSRPKSRPQVTTSNRQRNTHTASSTLTIPSRTSHTVKQSQRKKSQAAKVKIASSEEEDEDDDEDEEEDDERARVISFNGRSSSNEEDQQEDSRTSAHYMTSAYGSFPAPRPEEYYRNGIPPRPRPVIPSPYPSASMRSDTTIRGRLNFMPNPPGAGLVRPYYPSPSGYYAY